MLDLPVLAPEIAGVGNGVHRVSDEAYLLHAPVTEEALSELRSARPRLLILGNARALWNEGAPLVAAIRAIRTKVGAGPVLWAPRVALPHRLPLLAYLGLDLLDTTEGELSASRGEFLDPTLGRVDPSSAAVERICACDGCRSGETPGALAAHAREAYRRAFAQMRAALREGRLRELVEARLPAEPTVAEILRYADRDLAALLEERTPVTGTRSHDYVVLESHRRPEMVRFRARLLERYPASHLEVGPPYRPVLEDQALPPLPLAPTVRFRPGGPSGPDPGPRGLGQLADRRSFRASSRTSRRPSRYHIPVTGEWGETERKAVTDGLDLLLLHGRVLGDRGAPRPRRSTRSFARTCLRRCRSHGPSGTRGPPPAPRSTRCGPPRARPSKGARLSPRGRSRS